MLKKMSSHYKTQEPLPDDLTAKIIMRLGSPFNASGRLTQTLSRYANIGLFYLRQLFHATFALVVHDNSLDANTDYTKLWNELRQEIMHLKGGDQPGQGAFSHVASDYDVGYYGYVCLAGINPSQDYVTDTLVRYTYSLVFAADMYATVFKQGPLDPKSGRLYRDKILLPGWSKDEMDLLKVGHVSMTPGVVISLVCVRTFWGANPIQRHLSMKLNGLDNLRDDLELMMEAISDVRFSRATSELRVHVKIWLS